MSNASFKLLIRHRPTVSVWHRGARPISQKPYTSSHVNYSFYNLYYIQCGALDTLLKKGPTCCIKSPVYNSNTGNTCTSHSSVKAGAY